MLTSQFATRIRWHAGLLPTAIPGTPLADILEHDAFENRLFADAISDLLTALSGFNHSLNGSVPSEDVGHGCDIPRDVAYAVAEIARLLRVYVDVDPSVREAAWAVDTAWRAILAGDIDDIQQHLVDERMAGG